MEFGAEYEFTDSKQFWSELQDLLACRPMSSLSELDSSLKNYIALASKYMDEYLASPGELDHAICALLNAPFFTSHLDRMTAIIIATISSSASSSSLFISLMLILHLGLIDPLSASSTILHSDPTRSGTSKVFRAMRTRWNDVVPVLMKWVWDAGVVERDHAVALARDADSAKLVKKQQLTMPAEGWEERVGTAATTVLYEICRVQRLNADELAIFTYDFIEHLFLLVERTRDVEDETFNYTLIKLIIALNEQFMVSALPPPGQSIGGNGALPPPILPNIVGKRKAERGPNLVLEVLKSKEGESKTFGENIIFILNRSNGTPDSLCVSLLILKILYLLFTTAGTQEYFYTNDLCVLVDVFIRELCDLGEESEGLKHTYLRVLHPLLTNTQLRHHAYKRPQLQHVLQSLISPSSYREPDPTTRRLVERNLRAGWCESLPDSSAMRDVHRGPAGKSTARVAGETPVGTGSLGAAPALNSLRTGWSEVNCSSLSVDAVAQADDAGQRGGSRRSPAKRRSSEWSVASPDSPRSDSESAIPSLSSSLVLEPVREHSLAPAREHLQSVPTSRSGSFDGVASSSRRRRAPPPPSSDRPLTPSSSSPVSASPAPGQRRAAPEPPGRGQNRSGSAILLTEESYDELDVQRRLAQIHVGS